MSEAHGADLRNEVENRARGLCEYCQSPQSYSPTAFSIDHVIPRAAGGGEGVENLALSCQECNNRKYTSTHAVDPLTGENSLLFNPRRDTWTSHFAWSADLMEIIGLTSVGRAPVEKIRLNRRSVRNLRDAFRKIGAHPADGNI